MSHRIIAGLKEDCSVLATRFANKNCPDFATFAKIWKDMQFTLIFAGLTKRSAVIFTNEALALVKGFFLHTEIFLKKICSIYLLYGIYFKQPFKDLEKITVNLDEWVHIKKFIEVLREKQLYEALYCISRLIFSNAFDFSVTPRRHISIQAIKIYNEDFEKDKPLIDPINIDKYLKELETIQTKYENAKQQFFDSKGLPNYNYSCKNFSQVLKQSLATEVISSSSEEEKEDKKMKVGVKRKAIRMKGFKNVNKSALHKSTLVPVKKIKSED